MDSIEIFRKGLSFVTIKPDDNSTQTKTVMGDNILNLNFRQSNYISFEPGDHCTVFGEVYTIHALPIVTETGSNFFEYALTMHSEGADLSKAQYLFLGADNTLRESDFALMGNADDFIDLVLSNANRINPGWLKGQVIPTSYKNLSFKNENCYNALARLSEEFETEFWIEGRTIHLTKRGQEYGHRYQVGQNKGLYKIVRANVDNTSIITRIYAYGAEKNLPTTYIGRRLHLSSGYDADLVSDILYTVTPVGDGTINVFFTWTPPVAVESDNVIISYTRNGEPPEYYVNGNINGGFTVNMREGDNLVEIITMPQNKSVTFHVIDTITTPIFPNTPQPYVEKNINLYGIIEQTVFFEDVFPHRTGTVTGVNAIDPFVFVDSTIDFNINTYLLPGLTAKVTFNTGQLAGYTFDISAFDNGTKEVTILKNKNENKLDLPSTLFRPAIGDEYVIVDISMPQTYIDAAEAELLAKATEMLDIFSIPQVTIQAELDPKFMKLHNRTVAIGDYVWIIDVPLNIDRKIRIITTIRNVINETTYTITLSDTIVAGRLDRLTLSTNTTARDVTSLSGNVNSRDIFNGSLILPENAGGAGFQDVIIETATNKLFRKT